MGDLFGWRRPRRRVQYGRASNPDALPLEDVDPGHAATVRGRMFQRGDRERLYRKLQAELKAGGYAKNDPDMNKRIAEMYAELNRINRRT